MMAPKTISRVKFFLLYAAFIAFASIGIFYYFLQKTDLVDLHKLIVMGPPALVNVVLGIVFLYPVFAKPRSGLYKYIRILLYLTLLGFWAYPFNLWLIGAWKRDEVKEYYAALKTES